MSEVPKLSRNDLMGEVARLNIPLLDDTNQDHPLHGLFVDLRIDHPTLYQWGTKVTSNLNFGWGGTDERRAVESYAFDNAFIAAYGLMQVSYQRADRPMPKDEVLPKGHRFLNDTEDTTIGTVFKLLNKRQFSLQQEYPEFLEATQAYAYNRMPYHGQLYTVGAVGVAAAEMYFSFCDIEAASAER
jgi:hypothetical protein